MLQLYRNIFDEEFLLRSRPSSFSRFRCFRSAAARGETNSAAMHRNATVKSKVDDASPAAAAPMSFSQSSAESQSVWTCARSHEIRKIFFGIMRSFLASLVFLGFTSYSGIRGQEVTVPHRFRTSYQNGHDTVRFLSKKFVSSKKWKIFVLKRVAIICRLQIRLWYVPLCIYCIIDDDPDVHYPQKYLIVSRISFSILLILEKFLKILCVWFYMTPLNDIKSVGKNLQEFFKDKNNQNWHSLKKNLGGIERQFQKSPETPCIDAINH